MGEEIKITSIEYREMDGQGNYIPPFLQIDIWYVTQEKADRIFIGVKDFAKLVKWDLPPNHPNTFDKNGYVKDEYNPNKK